ncbi:TPA: hypothetical protein DDZ06_05100 [Candidatus Uhrbacteria bacterium]
MGAIERFVAVLIEHCGGSFPFWLAPEQIRLATVSDEFVDFARTLKGQLKEKGLRVSLDDSSEKVGRKIRQAAIEKVPWTVVIGAKEREGGDFQVNVFGQEERLVIAQKDFASQAQSVSDLPVVVLPEVV